MEVVVQGWRTSPTDWDAAKAIPDGQLPPLTPQQREVAHKLGIREEDYARSAYAGVQTGQKLLEKAERLGRLLQQMISEGRPEASIEKVALLTWEHRFDVTAKVDGRCMNFRVTEEVVDDLFEGGSEEANQKLSRILVQVLPARVA